MSVYGGTGYSSVYLDVTTHVQFDVTFTAADQVVPLDIYVDSNKVPAGTVNDRNVSYSYDLGVFRSAGEKIHIKIGHEGWGTTEYDMVVCDAPDAAYTAATAYSPTIDTLLRHIDSGDFSDTSLSVTVPATAIVGCTDITMRLCSPDNKSSYEALRSGTTFTFDLSAGNAKWLDIRKSLVADRYSGLFISTFEWLDKYSIGSKCEITSYYIGSQSQDSFSLPYKIEGVYDLTAKYTVSDGSTKKTVTGYTDVVTITRDYKTLGVSGRTGVTGTINARRVILTGHLLDANSVLDGQQFEGTYEASSGIITGYITGYAVDNPSGGTAKQCTLSNTSFSLTPR